MIVLLTIAECNMSFWSLPPYKLRLFHTPAAVPRFLILVEGRWYFWRHVVAVMVLTSTDRLLLLYFTKISYYLCSFFFRSLKEYCGLGSRVLDDWCGTVTLQGSCILYNYTLFVWVIHRDQKKCTILVAKRCTREPCIEVSLYNICDHSSCALLFL